MILVGFDQAHEFPAHRWVVGQLANRPPDREVLSRGNEALAAVNRGWQIASAKDGTRGEPNCLQPSPKNAWQLYPIPHVAAYSEMICLSFHGLLFLGRANLENSIPHKTVSVISRRRHTTCKIRL